MPFFSIIVPVYKTEKYLEECVDSVLSQSFGDFELILVDDGSPDNCPEMCDGYAKKDSRVKVIHKKNGGVSSARNSGLDVASGYYIWFADSDDRIFPGALEKLYESVRTSDADIVTFDLAVEKNDGSVFYHKIPDGEYTISDSEIISAAFFWLPEFNKKSINIEVCGNVIKNDLIKTNGICFNTKLFRSEDVVFMLECYSASKAKGTQKRKSIACPCYFYRYNRESCMNTFEYSRQTVKNSVEFLRSIKKVLTKNGIPVERYAEPWNKLFVRIPVEPFLDKKKRKVSAKKIKKFLCWFSEEATVNDLIDIRKSKKQRFEEYVVFNRKNTLLRIYIVLLRLYGSVMTR